MVGKIKDNLKASQIFIQAFDYRRFKELFGSSLAFEVLENPFRGKVLVLAPHPDDEIIGLGGALAQHVVQEDEIKIIYLTDGSLGFPDNIRPTSSEKNAMAKRREAEAKEAAEVLGLKDLNFWRFKDGSLVANKTTIKLMQNILLSYKPEIVYCPFPLDSHHDHQETAKILYEALRLSDSKAKVFCYEVWTPLFANKIINIDSTIKKKLEALKKYQSQLDSRNYLGAVEGLAKYRSGMYDAGSHAEAYFASTADYYLKLFFQLKCRKF